jgi:hypothetical protein
MMNESSRDRTEHVDTACPIIVLFDSNIMILHVQRSTFNSIDFGLSSFLAQSPSSDRF